MKHVDVEVKDSVAVISLGRGKVNALNEQVVEELQNHFQVIREDDAIGSVVLTGKGTKFFSFGFDIPEFLGYSKGSFTRYLTKFTKLCADIFLFPKPVVAALNGHTIAGGCMLATACDSRIMVGGKAKISLNEVTFGSSVFAGSVEILRYCVGSAAAQEILYSGRMYSAEEALAIRLVDRVSGLDDLAEEARGVAQGFCAKDRFAFASIKRLLRGPVYNEMIQREESSIREFVEIWYSESTWKNLQGIKIAS